MILIVMKPPNYMENTITMTGAVNKLHTTHYSSVLFHNFLLVPKFQQKANSSFTPPKFPSLKATSLSFVAGHTSLNLRVNLLHLVLRYP